jgi:hypothetical protein
LIKSRIEKVRIKREQDPKCPSVIIFIAPKKALLHQQIDYIKIHAAPISADEFHGDKKLNNKHIDLWDPREWSEQVSKFEVLGMTPAILQQLLETRKIPHHIIDLLILDECHYAKGGDSSKCSACFFTCCVFYISVSLVAKLCEAIRISNDCKPLIFGMSASPIQMKIKTTNDLFKAIMQLEKMLMATFFYPTEQFLNSLSNFFKKPKLFLINYENQSPTSNYKSLARSLDQIDQKLTFMSVVAEIYHDEKAYNDQEEFEKCFYFQEIISSVGLNFQFIQIQEEFAPKLASEFNYSKKAIHQTIKSIKTCGIYLGLASLSISLREREQDRQRKQLFTDVRRIDLLQELNPEWTNELTLNREILSPLFSVSVSKSIDLKVLHDKTSDLIKYLAGDQESFRGLLNHRQETLSCYCDLLKNICRSLGHEICVQAIENLNSKRVCESENSQKRLQFFIDLIQGVATVGACCLIFLSFLHCILNSSCKLKVSATKIILASWLLFATN